jgi:imidazolonepropionase-like amidohydrolase
MLTSLIAAAATLLAAADSVVYPVLNHDRPAGTMVVTRNGDSVRVRYVFTDRNRGTRLELREVVRGDALVSLENRPVLADGRAGDPTFRIEIVGDSIRQTTPQRSTTEKVTPGVYYTATFSPYDQVRFARYLLRQPNRSAKVSAASTVTLAVLREATVPTKRGNERVKLISMSNGTSPAPQLVWLDSNNDLFATAISWFMTIKPGAEPALPALRKMEMAVDEAAAEALNKRVVKSTNGTIAITGGDVFDSETGTMRPRTNVIIRGDRITAVGPAESTPAPAGATIIDATGKTVVPGLWDMHGHMQETSQSLLGVMQLSFGITTVRDLGSDPDVAQSNRDRAQAGKIAAPREILSGFIDGPGNWAGPTPIIVRTENEARAWVAHFDSLGYKQIKLYNLIHPDLVPTFAAEAHKRGMRLSGHIPRGLSVPAAIGLGFDEVNHAAFLFSTFYQDSLYVPTMRAYSLVATTVAPNIDVDGAPMTGLINLLKQHNTVVDGTFSVWITSAGTGIAQNVGAGVSSNAQKSDAAYMRLIRRLFDAGVTMVPGTDNPTGNSYNAELEVYEQAGVPAPTVLQMATIISARVMKDDKDYGSLAPGKVADVVIVNGRPADHVSDLRKVEHVIRAGRLYDVQDLKLATGLARR